MKKWLTFLLLLITLTGTFYPCCLEDECSDEEVAASKKQSEREGEGACSPFFACATCPGFAVMHKPVQIVQALAQPHEHHEALIVFNLTTYSSSFWQPPRSC